VEVAQVQCVVLCFGDSGSAWFGTLELKAEDRVIGEYDGIDPLLQSKQFVFESDGPTLARPRRHQVADGPDRVMPSCFLVRRSRKAACLLSRGQAADDVFWFLGEEFPAIARKPRLHVRAGVGKRAFCLVMLKRSDRRGASTDF